MSAVPMRRIFASAASLMAVAAVIGGIYLAGSPAKERMRQLDLRRENDLQTLASAVDSYNAKEGRLPVSLQALVNPETNYLSASMVDPETEVAYEYMATGDTTYELCAVFALESSETDAYGNLRPVPAEVMKPGSFREWSHGAGRTCFTLDARDYGAGVSCALTMPCAAGQSCVTLPGRSGAYCVPQGKECLAAACAGDCTIAESYPAQVRCVGEPSGKKPAGSSTCDLMQETETGKVDCFGCAGTTCKDPGPGWTMYERDPNAMGIPYACFESEQGCQLAQ